MHKKHPLAAGAALGYEEQYEALANRVLRGELSIAEAEAEWERILRGPTPLTIQTYAAQLRRKTVLLRNTLGVQSPAALRRGVWFVARLADAGRFGVPVPVPPADVQSLPNMN
jgi:hypothetical protein